MPLKIIMQTKWIWFLWNWSSQVASEESFYSKWFLHKVANMGNFRWVREFSFCCLTEVHVFFPYSVLCCSQWKQREHAASTSAHFTSMECDTSQLSGTVIAKVMLEWQSRNRMGQVCSSLRKIVLAMWQREWELHCERF